MSRSPALPRRSLAGVAIFATAALALSTFATLSTCHVRLGATADVSGCDFSAEDLSDKDLHETNLGGSDLSDTDLSEADLSRADLAGADLTGADLTGANLSEADLSGADLAGATIARTLFHDAVLARTDLHALDLSAQNLHGVDLTDANLAGAALVNSGLDESILSGADLTGADLARASLGRADLSGAVVVKADLGAADLRAATLEDADLRDARLQGAQLDDADLTGADLDGADLTHTQLTGASLQGASLADADLSRADLSRADLTDADLDGVVLKEASLVDVTGLTDSDLAGALGVGERDLARRLAEHRIRLEDKDDVLAALGAACRGAGVPDAAGFPVGDFHPLTLLTTGGKPTKLTNAVDPTWEPMAVRFAQLVACVGAETRETVEVCSYFVVGTGERGAPVTRSHRLLRARLVEARTGKTVAERVFTGSEPEVCQFQVFGYYDKTLVGSHVGAGQVRPWLRDQVEG